MAPDDIGWFKSPSPEKCVSCGKAIELGERGFPDHHCSPQHEAAVEAAHRRAQDDLLPYKPPYSQRLKDGFHMSS